MSQDDVSVVNSSFYALLANQQDSLCGSLCFNCSSIKLAKTMKKDGHSHSAGLLTPTLKKNPLKSLASFTPSAPSRLHVLSWLKPPWRIFFFYFSIYTTGRCPHMIWSHWACCHDLYCSLSRLCMNAEWATNESPLVGPIKFSEPESGMRLIQQTFSSAY